MIGLYVLVVTLAVTVIVGVALRVRDGRIRPGRTMPIQGAGQEGTDQEGTDQGGNLLAQLGITPGAYQVTLVQFSSAFCQPCVATRKILDQVVGMVEGVTHIEVDAESHLDLVRRLGIMRTPTVLILDQAGRETKRATGTPRKADLIAAIGPLIAAK